MMIGKLPAWIVLSIFAVLVTGAIIGISIGIANHQEEGLLNVVWTDNRATYEPIRDEVTTELTWPKEQIPILISVIDPAGEYLPISSEEVNEVRQAIDDFNDQVGFDLFEFSSTPDVEDASVIWGLPIEVGRNSPAGLVSHRRLSNGEIQGLVRLWETTSIRTTHQVLMHELGHLIGLAHDDFQDSLMYPTYQDNNLGESTGSIRITDSDVALLKRLYQ